MAANLYKSARNARRVLIIFLILGILYTGWEAYNRFSASTIIKPELQIKFYKEPDYLIGKLGQITFPTIPGVKINSSVTPQYSISTPFDKFPDVAYVYEINKPREKLNTKSDVIKVATTLGFNSQGDVQGDNYLWKNSQNTKTLEFNITTQVFKLKTSFTDNIEAKKKKILLTQLTQYENPARSLISQLGFSDGYGLSGATVDAQYADISSDAILFKPDNNLSAQYAILNIFRKLDYSELKPSSAFTDIQNKSLIPKVPSKVNAYKSDARQGSLKAVISNDLSSYSRDIFELDFTNFEYKIVNGNISRGLYPIVTPQEAWSLASSGKGVITLLYPDNGNSLINYSDLSIRKLISDGAKTEFGYYEPEAWTGYVYPIYIFKGRAELEDGRQASFKIYVDALKRIS